MIEKQPEQITGPQLERFRKNGYLTIGRLRKWIEENKDLPDDSLVMVQRVEDKYYDGIYIDGLRGPDGILLPGSKTEGWNVYYKESDMGLEQYSPAWSCVRYSDEINLMFIDLHY